MFTPRIERGSLKARVNAMRITRHLIALALVVVVALAVLPAAKASEPADAGAIRNRYVFVVNRIYARPDALARALDAMALFINETMTADDRAMVIEIGYSTRVLHDFSSSKDAIIATIEGIGLTSVSTLGNEAAHQFYDSLQWLGETLQEVSGHTVVILASNEPNRMRTSKLYMGDAIDALNEGNASVYSIDLGLLHRGFPRYGVSGLAALSSGTGGIYFQTQSRVSFVPAMRQLTALIQGDDSPSH